MRATVKRGKRRRLTTVVMLRAQRVGQTLFAVGSSADFVPWLADDLIAAGVAALPGTVVGRQVEPEGDHAAVVIPAVFAVAEPDPEKPARPRRRRKKGADSGDGR